MGPLPPRDRKIPHFFDHIFIFFSYDHLLNALSSSFGYRGGYIWWRGHFLVAGKLSEPLK